MDGKEVCERKRVFTQGKRFNFPLSLISPFGDGAHLCVEFIATKLWLSHFMCKINGQQEGNFPGWVFSSKSFPHKVICQ